MGYLDPQTGAPQRPSVEELSRQDEDGADLRGSILYLRSYLLMRAVIGFIGVGLPFALVLGTWALEPGGWDVKGSLSAYFYSGMRDVFVGALCVAGLFLLTYKVFEHNLENLLSLVAGIAALGVALFSTDRPGGSSLPLTPLQERLGEGHVAVVHYTCAAVFILGLGGISTVFALREGNRGRHHNRLSPTFWRGFHALCVGGIAVAVAFIAVTSATGWLKGHALFIGETLAILSFGASWLAKGLELRILLGPKAAKRDLQRQQEAEATVATA